MLKDMIDDKLFLDIIENIEVAKEGRNIVY